MFAHRCSATRATLTKARLSGATLTKADLSEADLVSAFWSEETQWPSECGSGRCLRVTVGGASRKLGTVVQIRRSRRLRPPGDCGKVRVVLGRSEGSGRRARCARGSCPSRMPGRPARSCACAIATMQERAL
ncbi:pentapeptide repeat-containing protein [Streptomyces tauricus]|uniref:pentapeptide repeat-containing protein n=1 Tax=Streptomyces tauricus TaxID=68274 RepID=UPI001BCA5C84